MSRCPQCAQACEQRKRTISLCQALPGGVPLAVKQAVREALRAALPVSRPIGT